MVNEGFAMAVMVMVVTWPAYVLPVVIGIILFTAARDKPLARLLGLFTIKPLVTTPLWAMLYSYVGHQGPLHGTAGQLLTLLPGVGLTLLILWVRRGDLHQTGRLLIPILVLDALRWINSFLFMMDELFRQVDLSYSYQVGLVLPNLFALMALVMVLTFPRGHAARPEPASPQAA